MMPLHAVDDIGDAIDATKSLLVPFELGMWLRLAFVVLFLGGGGGGLNSIRSFNGFTQEYAPNDGGRVALTGLLERITGSVFGQINGPVPGGIPSEAASSVGLSVIVVVVTIVGLSLAVGVLSNFMEFVFAQSLIEREVHVRRYVSANIGNGLRLLGFRLVVQLLSLVITAAVLLGLFVTVFGGSLDNIDAATTLSALPVVVGFLIVGTLVVGLLTGFTNVFVVPLMIQGNHGLVAGWRRLLSSMTEQPKQYLAYLLFSIVLAIGVGIVGSILGLLVFLLLLIPFFLLGACVVVGLGQSTLSFALVAVLAVVAGLLLIVAANLIKVPLQAFLRYYAMLVLGDIDETLDPIPAVRESIRT